MGQYGGGWVMTIMFWKQSGVCGRIVFVEHPGVVAPFVWSFPSHFHPKLPSRSQWNFTLMV